MDNCLVPFGILPLPAYIMGAVQFVLFADEIQLSHYKMTLIIDYQKEQPVSKMQLVAGVLLQYPDIVQANLIICIPCVSLEGTESRLDYLPKMNCSQSLDGEARPLLHDLMVASLRRVIHDLKLSNRSLLYLNILRVFGQVMGS